MVLLIDNYDSFVYNLARYLEELGVEVEVLRNDAVTVEELIERSPEAIVISPDPVRRGFPSSWSRRCWGGFRCWESAWVTRSWLRPPVPESCGLRVRFMARWLRSHTTRAGRRVRACLRGSPAP